MQQPYSHFDGIVCSSQAVCVASGSLYEESYCICALIERWNGASWSQNVAVESEDAEDVDAVSCSSASAWTAIGGNDAGNRPVIVRRG
jgi:hypothetical protein